MTAETSLPVAFSLTPVVDPQGKYPENAQFWAEPDIEDAAALLRAIASDGDRHARMCAAAREWGQRSFSTFPL
jgi:hypothetical protein